MPRGWRVSHELLPKYGVLSHGWIPILYSIQPWVDSHMMAYAYMGSVPGLGDYRYEPFATGWRLQLQVCAGSWRLQILSFAKYGGCQSLPSMAVVRLKESVY